MINKCTPESIAWHFFFFPSKDIKEKFWPLSQLIERSSIYDRLHCLLVFFLHLSFNHYFSSMKLLMWSQKKLRQINTLLRIPLSLLFTFIDFKIESHTHSDHFWFCVAVWPLRLWSSYSIFRPRDIIRKECGFFHVRKWTLHKSVSHSVYPQLWR